MGYTTDFMGRFDLDKPLTQKQVSYLRQFASTRHMRRDESLVARLPDETRKAVKLPIGPEGAFFVGDDESGVLDYNSPPKSQPGLWCQWIPTSGGHGIEWDGNEKFYEYTKWLQYIIKNFLKPWGYTLSGEVQWQGENFGDRGTLKVVNNVVFELDERQIKNETLQLVSTLEAQMIRVSNEYMRSEGDSLSKFLTTSKALISLLKKGSSL